MIRLSEFAGGNEVTVEEWMRFFNLQWENNPDGVYTIVHAIERRILGREAKRWAPSASMPGRRDILPTPMHDILPTPMHDILPDPSHLAG